MDTAPVPTPGAPGPVRLGGGSEPGLLYGPGWSVEVLCAYPAGWTARLYSLAARIEFVCAECGEWCEATLVTVRDEQLVCPGCYPAVAAGERNADVRIGGFRPCREEPAPVKLYASTR
ncbi:hypothetical protein [Prauserella muralis]|nr:hypothetical protein [Prauserella muralis]